MIEQFNLLLDLLNIDLDQQYIDVAKYIENNKAKNVLTYHRYGFVFEYFSKFVNGTIDMEEFVALGDITSTSKIEYNQSDLKGFLSSIDDIKDSIIIISKIEMKNIFSNIEIEQWMLKNNNNQIYLI